MGAASQEIGLVVGDLVGLDVGVSEGESPGAPVGVVPGMKEYEAVVVATAGGRRVGVKTRRPIVVDVGSAVYEAGELPMS